MYTYISICIYAFIQSCMKIQANNLFVKVPVPHITFKSFR